MNLMLSNLWCGILAAFTLHASAEELVPIYVKKSSKGVVCEVKCNPFDYVGCTNFLSTTTLYDGKVTFVFMGVAPDVEAKYVMGMLSCLRNSGFKSLFWDCDMGEGEFNLWDELPLWFFTPGKLGDVPVVSPFDARELGLISFNAWEKTYIPHSIEDGVKTVKNNLVPEKKTLLEKMSVEQLRYENGSGLGEWMRVNWVLSGKRSRLRDYCSRVKQVSIPGEITWIILNLLQRDLRGEQVDYSGEFFELAETSTGKVERQ